MKYITALNPCPLLWASDFPNLGTKKTGTSRSHDDRDVMNWINQD